MNVYQLVGKLGVQREGDEGGIIATKGLAASATRWYNEMWGPGTVVETPHKVDSAKVVYHVEK